MSEIFLDAFDEGRKEETIYGSDIFEEKSTFSFADLQEVPSSKNNNVSFMKLEAIEKDCRNILSVTDSYISYSVTTKRNVMRLIDTYSGSKSILRGHESSILDIKISPVDNSIFVSIDSFESTTNSHVFVWKRNKPDELEFEPIKQLPLPAQIVQPHPLDSNIWAISHNANVAIFNIKSLDNGIPSSYANCKLNYNLGNDKIKQLIFSSDGEYLIALVQSPTDRDYINVWRVTTEGLVNLTNYSNALRVEGLITISAFANYFVTVSKQDEYSFEFSSVSNMMNYQVKLWKLTPMAKSYPIHSSSSQTITFQLPEYKSIFPNNIFDNTYLECALSVEPKQGRYMILSSRKSNYLACFGINNSSQGWPLYHITLVNLITGVISMDITTIVGRDHHSQEQGEHVEVTCYQEKASDTQYSIQQYHVLTNCLFNLPKYLNILMTSHSPRSPPPLAPLNTSVDTKSQALLGILGSSKSPTPVASTPTTTQQPMDFTPSVMTVDKSALSALSTQTTPVVAPQPVAPITSGLKKIDSSMLFSSKKEESAPVAPTSAVQSTPLSAAALLASLKPATTPAVVEPEPTKADSLPDFLKSAPKSNTNILTMFSTPSATTTTSNATPVPPTSSNPFPINSPIISPLVEEEKPPASKLFSLLGINAKVIPATTNTQPVEVATEADQEEESIDSLASDGGVEALTPAISSSDINQIFSMLSELKQEIRSRPSNGSYSTVSTNSTASPSSQPVDWFSVKQDIIAEVQRQQTKSTNQLHTQMKHIIEQENKKMTELLTKHKQDITQSILEQLQTKFIPTMLGKTKDMIKDTLRDTIKNHLSDSFRNAFESSLLPAFQAGTDQLFGQLNHAFENGMKDLITVNETIQQNNEFNYKELQDTVYELKSRINDLESTIRDMSNQMSSLSVGGFMTDNDNKLDILAEEIEEVKLTPFDLLQQGKIDEAVRLALENKDVEVTVSVLSKLNHNDLKANCSNLVRLCITQQLAADMSVNMPSEGIAKRVEWIKNLVFSLVQLSANDIDSDPKLCKNWKAMISTVLDSISTAKQLVVESQYDNGEDDVLEIPASVSLDLELLEFLIRSKI